MIKIITPVDTEPVTLTEVRQHLRLPDDPAEDALLSFLIATARNYCEDYTRRTFAGQTLEACFERFPGTGPILLPCPPLRSVVEIGYTDSSGLETILPAFAYMVSIICEPGRVLPAFGMSWPVFTPYAASPIRIRYVAGYETLPATLKQAMLLLISHWYETREATGTAVNETAFSVHALLSPYRLEAF